MYDYIVVGAGTAGCILASRLTEDPSVSVMLLEAGGSERVKEVGIPAAFSKLFGTERDWAFETVPQAQLSERSLSWPRGKMLGGSSSMNAMMWVRGVPADFDGWPEGWSYEDVRPVFRRIEDTERPGGAHVGRGGPLPVAELADPNPATHLFVEAAQRVGIPRNPNCNAGDNLGVDYTQANQRRGRRASIAWAYLRPAMRRPNLTVLTGAHALGVVIEDRTATGVRHAIDGRIETVTARREVILSGGAVNSPQLLMLSGIGPAVELEAVGIEPVADVAGVGQNLSDHLAAGLVAGTSRTDSLVAAERPAELLRYLTRRRGMLTSTVAEAFAFITSRPELAQADLELIFAPVPFLDHGRTDPPGHGYTLGAVLLQPASRGTIRLASSDPIQPPLIDPAYLSQPGDLETLRAGIRRVIEILRTSPLAEVISDPIRPAAWPETDEDIEASIRDHAETLYHPVGTCRMGTGPGAVVDPELNVHGVRGLRVVDASVMPSLNRGHTHAPVVMIAERAAELVHSSRT